MSTSVQYAALARLLNHNNRVHDLDDMLNRMLVPLDYPLSLCLEDDSADLPVSPFAELQDEMDRETRASLVTCWLAMPAAHDEEHGEEY